MSTRRTLRYGMTGADVLEVKKTLFRLGYYAPDVTQVTKESFGDDTRTAVKAFQRANGLTADGIVGKDTYAALDAADGSAQTDSVPTDPATIPIPDNIGAAATEAVRSALVGVSALRRGIVLDALQFAFDRTVGGAYPLSLYIRGGNLYTTALKPNIITLSTIASGASRQPEYYDNGRREMMEATVRSNPSVTGADCSGGVVGLLRHAGVVSKGFDLSADGFASRYAGIGRDALRPADLVHKSGHIGVFVGGGYVVEWMGGAYGCQLTKLLDRRGYSFVTKKTGSMGAWTRFLRMNLG